MTTSRSKTAFYSKLGPAARAIALASASEVEETEADETEGTFKKGDALRRTQEALVENTFDEWLKFEWPYDRSYAFRFIKVSNSLWERRGRLTAARVPRACLFLLSRAPNRIDEVLASYERGDRLTVSEVRRLVLPSKTADSLTRDIGGLQGLRALYHAKEPFLRVFLMRLRWIHDQIQAALEGATARRQILKRAHVTRVKVPARLCWKELRSLCLHPVPDQRDPMAMAWTTFPLECGWARLSEILSTLSREQGWASGKELSNWLRQEALPSLDWAIGDSKTVLKGASIQSAQGTATAVFAESARSGSIEEAASTKFDPIGKRAIAEAASATPAAGTQLNNRHIGSATQEASTAFEEGNEIRPFVNFLFNAYKEAIERGIPPEEAMLIMERAASSFAKILTKLVCPEPSETTQDSIMKTIVLGFLSRLHARSGGIATTDHNIR